MPETKMGREEIMPEKLSQEELLEIIAELLDNPLGDNRAYNQIRTLIQQPRKVRREFLEKWADTLIVGFNSEIKFEFILEKMLKELDIEVEK